MNRECRSLRYQLHISNKAYLEILMVYLLEPVDLQSSKKYEQIVYAGNILRFILSNFS